MFLFRLYTGIFEENGRMLAIALRTNDYDTQYIPLFGSNVCATESNGPFDLVREAFIAVAVVLIAIDFIRVVFPISGTWDWICFAVTLQ